MITWGQGGKNFRAKRVKEFTLWPISYLNLDLKNRIMNLVEDPFFDSLHYQVPDPDKRQQIEKFQ